MRLRTYGWNFKSTIPKEDQTLKKLSSFANTYGGVMLIGAEEQDGRITNLCGVPLEPGYRQTVANWCFIKFNPPLVAEVSEPIKLTNGQFCYVVSVPESDVGPHFINGRKGVWIRTDEFTNRFGAELANENELRALFYHRFGSHRRPHARPGATDFSSTAERCAQCGHIGCCDSSPSQHATKHYASTGHTVVASFEPGEYWFFDYE